MDFIIKYVANTSCLKVCGTMCSQPNFISNYRINIFGKSAYIMYNWIIS